MTKPSGQTLAATWGMGVAEASFPVSVPRPSGRRWSSRGECCKACLTRDGQRGDQERHELLALSCRKSRNPLLCLQLQVAPVSQPRPKRSEQNDSFWWFQNSVTTWSVLTCGIARPLCHVGLFMREGQHGAKQKDCFAKWIGKRHWTFVFSH